MIVTFVLFLIANVPIAVAIGLATFFMVLCVSGSTGTVAKAMTMIAQRMATGIDSFSLLAIPFFILSGLFMGRGGIARRLINFAATLVGRFKGGLAFVNILTCMFFGAISGSAVA